MEDNDVLDDIERIKTHIVGFDDELEGGIPKGSVVLVSGSPGTMKSSIAYNILFYNALKEGKKGLYITLEQSRASLLRHLKHLKMERKRKIHGTREPTRIKVNPGSCPSAKWPAAAWESS